MSPTIFTKILLHDKNVHMNVKIISNRIKIKKKNLISDYCYICLKYFFMTDLSMSCKC